MRFHHGFLARPDGQEGGGIVGDVAGLDPAAADAGGVVAAGYTQGGLFWTALGAGLSYALWGRPAFALGAAAIAVLTSIASSVWRSSPYSTKRIEVAGSASHILSS